MSKDQIYDAWNPADSPWTRWVKPVLFSYLGDAELQMRAASVRPWNIPPVKNTAILANLPDG